MVEAKKLVLLLNIGSPASTSPKHVGRYLRRFLSDARVISLPWLARMFLVYCIIVPFRKRRSAAEYRKIWSADGSPLIDISTRLASMLQQKLGSGYSVRALMRYSNPGIESAPLLISGLQPDEVILVPMYPHYASSTTGSACQMFFGTINNLDWIPPIRVTPPFYKHKAFINFWARAVAAASWRKYDAVLFSYHSLPVKHLVPACGHGAAAGCCSCPVTELSKNCYKSQCLETTELISKQAGLDNSLVYTSFQSRFDKNWAGPFTEQVAMELLGNGKRKLLVLCPGFTADCLETLAEIGIELRNKFVERGGEELCLLPCPNYCETWADAMAEIITGQ
jgi:protoporphyrin/coproporphyrin ferrochelatase